MSAFHAAVHVTAITVQQPSLHHATRVHSEISFTVLHNNGQCAVNMGDVSGVTAEIGNSLALYVSIDTIQKNKQTKKRHSLFASHANWRTRLVDGYRDADLTAFSSANQALFLLILDDLIAADASD